MVKSVFENDYFEITLSDNIWRVVRSWFNLRLLHHKDRKNQAATKILMQQNFLTAAVTRYISNTIYIIHTEAQDFHSNVNSLLHICFVKKSFNWVIKKLSKRRPLVSHQSLSLYYKFCEQMELLVMKLALVKNEICLRILWMY